MNNFKIALIFWAMAGLLMVADMSLTESPYWLSMAALLATPFLALIGLVFCLIGDKTGGIK